MRQAIDYEHEFEGFKKICEDCENGVLEWSPNDEDKEIYFCDFCGKEFEIIGREYKKIKKERFKVENDLFEKKKYCLMNNGDVLELVTLYSEDDIDYALGKVLVEKDNDVLTVKVRTKIKPENIISQDIFEERYKNKLITKLSEKEFEAKSWTAPIN